VRRRWAWAGLAVVASLGLLGGCASTGEGGGSEGDGGSSAAVTATVPPPTTPTSSSPSSTAAPPPTGALPARERLAVLVVDDRPSPRGTYRREDWPHWEDPDGNGCDARQDTLVRWSTTTVTLDRSRRCKVLAGRWVSPYDGLVAASPAEIEIDHLVPLAEAFRSGGWQWDAGRRRQFANDPIELAATSSSSNRAKSDDRPDQWRPARTESWCAYADRWVTVKETYGLTVTTSERDALGQMLDTCTPASETWP
jgi:Protein of unknown function (DUF1524)